MAQVWLTFGKGAIDIRQIFGKDLANTRRDAIAFQERLYGASTAGYVCDSSGKLLGNIAMAAEKGKKRVKDTTPKLLRARAESIKQLSNDLLKAAKSMEVNEMPSVPVDGYQSLMNAIRDIGSFHGNWERAYKKQLAADALENDE